MATESRQSVPEKVLVLPSELNQDFYLDYLRFIKYIHKLTDGQMQVLAAFLYQRHLLSRDISNPEILDQVTLSRDVRKRIRESFGMTSTHFQVIMSKFKERGIISEGRINPKVIPNIPSNPSTFRLSIYFKFDEHSDKDIQAGV